VRGKKLLLVGEQGLGDEITCSDIPAGCLCRVWAKRATADLRRSAPDTLSTGAPIRPRWGTYDDRTLMDDMVTGVAPVPFATKDNKPDFWAPMGSALQ